MADGGKESDTGHFTGLGTCEIHTSRSHVKCSNAGKGGCDHQDNCAQPSAKNPPPPWGDRWESHHILCISCVHQYQVLAAYDAERREFIDMCYQATAWCINQAPNLIALPMKTVYRTEPDNRALNLPCHDWDHNNTGGYTDEVTAEIHTKVWQELKETGKKAACKAGKTIVVEQLKTLSKTFRTTLEGRGNRKVGRRRGTAAAWDESREPRATRAKNWWYSFSMAKDEVAAARPAASFGEPHWASAQERLDAREKIAETKNKG